MVCIVVANLVVVILCHQYFHYFILKDKLFKNHTNHLNHLLLYPDRNLHQQAMYLYHLLHDQYLELSLMVFVLIFL